MWKETLIVIQCYLLLLFVTSGRVTLFCYLLLPTVRVILFLLPFGTLEFRPYVDIVSYNMVKIL